MPQGSRGRIIIDQDFTGGHGDVTWGTGEVDLGGGLGLVSVNEGTINTVADEANGVVQFLTDTGDNDNVALYGGQFSIDNGGAVIEARFKVADDLGVSIFCGFSETLALDTPVVPAEFSVTTMTYNGTGGMVGAQYDSAGTTDGWRAVMGDGGAAISDSSNGILSTAAAPAADTYQLVRVELFSSGGGLVTVDEKVIKKFDTGTLLTTTDNFYGVLIVENRTAAAREVEVDYVYINGNRDWTA